MASARNRKTSSTFAFPAPVGDDEHVEVLQRQRGGLQAPTARRWSVALAHAGSLRGVPVQAECFAPPAEQAGHLAGGAEPAVAGGPRAGCLVRN